MPASSTENETNSPVDSVYVSKAEQDNVNSIILKSDEFQNFLDSHGISIVAETITPVYTADILEYAKKENFEIKPLVVDSFGRNVDAPQDSQNNYYTVKAYKT